MLRRLAAILLASVLCLGVAACGSSGSPPSKTAASAGAPEQTNSAALNTARVNAAKCMRAQGINIPDPSADPGAIRKVIQTLGTYPQSKVQSAEQACAAEIKKALPNAANLSSAQRAQILHEAVVFATCMRSHGISFPDPSLIQTNPLAFYQGLSQLDTSSPAVKSVGQTCRAEALKSG
jgi:hypothetical protein